MKKGKLVILSGPSGVGKGTVRNEIMKDENFNLHFSISMTTRKPRQGEVDGKDYFFVDDKTFDEALKNNKLLEHAVFVNNKYGTPKDYVDSMLSEGKNVLVEIETNGAKQVMDLYDKKDYVSIFLICQSLEELEKRIRGRRSEPEDVIKERVEKAKKEIPLASNYDYTVLNDDPVRAANEIKNIIINLSK